MSQIQAIVGLGNPGPDYALTRHNAGALWVAHLAARHGQSLKPEKKFQGLYSRIQVQGNDLHLLFPGTYMNRSGQSVLALSQFFKIPLNSILVAHDELDLETGFIRLKKDGGHGGHNGLRDIIKSFGNASDFPRLRIGISHPGHKDRVHGHVLGRLSDPEQSKLSDLFSLLDTELDTIVSGKWDGVMNRLHSYKPT